MRKGKRRTERSQTIDCSQVQGVDLLAGIAQCLLNLELELETNCTATLVIAVVEQYQQAIELFESRGDRRYQELQLRMHKMLLRPDVQLALGCTPVKESAHSVPTAPSSKASDPQQSLDFPVNRSLVKMFDAQENTSKSTALQVQKDKELQDEQLRARLMQRSSRHCSRKTSPGGRRKLALDMLLIEEPFSSFSAQVSPRESSTTTGSSEAGEGPFDELELKLEEVMERSFATRAQRLADIRARYEPDLRDLESQSGELMKQVADRTRAALEQELAEACREIDDARKLEVRQLRQQFLAGV